MRFRGLEVDLLELAEIEAELAYQTKRLYRLEKLERWGKQVEPDLKVCRAREAQLDLERRRRRAAMEEIPT